MRSEFLLTVVLDKLVWRVTGIFLTKQKNRNDRNQIFFTYGYTFLFYSHLSIKFVTVRFIGIQRAEGN